MTEHLYGAHQPDTSPFPEERSLKPFSIAPLAWRLCRSSYLSTWFEGRTAANQRRVITGGNRTLLRVKQDPATAAQGSRGRIAAAGGRGTRLLVLGSQIAGAPGGLLGGSNVDPRLKWDICRAACNAQLQQGVCQTGGSSL
jgi:hypothetical protein